MNHFQRIVNLLAIAAVLYYLHTLNGPINQKYADYVGYNQIVRALGNNDTLSQSMIQTISAFSQNQQPSNLQNTPLCLFKAYSSIVIKQRIDAQGLFYLFQLSQHQYDNVDTCLNYYSILLVRAQTLQDQVRLKIAKILEGLQKEEIARKYKTQKDSQNICIYFSTFNNQKSAKVQIAALAAQQYQKFSVQIDDRGSTDNTVIISTYMLQQLYNNTEAKITISANKDRKGPISGLLQFTQKCQSDSIVLVVAENQTLVGSYALELVSRVFASQDVDIAVFSSLSQANLNFQYPHGQEELKKVASPVVAFRKSALLEGEKLLRLQKQAALRPFWRNLLSQHLISLKDKRVVRTVNEGVVSSRSARKNLQQGDIELLQTKYNQVALAK